MSVLTGTVIRTPVYTFAAFSSAPTGSPTPTTTSHTGSSAAETPAANIGIGVGVGVGVGVPLVLALVGVVAYLALQLRKARRAGGSSQYYLASTEGPPDTHQMHELPPGSTHRVEMPAPGERLGSAGN